MQVLDLMSSIVIFRELRVDHATEILQIYHKKTFNAGEYVIKAGTVGDEIYVIHTGVAECLLEDKASGQTVVKPYFPGDYFGEQALLDDNVERTSDIIAKTELELVYFHKEDFIRLVRRRYI
jgi:CRP-like cAMP-binding protein